MIKLQQLISLSGGKSVSGRFSIDCSKMFERIKGPHGKQDCLDCDSGKKCSDCGIDPKRNCLNCEAERACKSCLERISQTKTYYTDINMLKRKAANEYIQMLPWYVGEYKTKTSTINYEAAKEVLSIAEKLMIEKRPFERINIMIACISYIKNEVVPGNKEIFVYGFKNIKTDKIENHILIGCKSEVFLENIEVFNFWSNKFINEKIQKRNIKITGWCFMTLVKRNNFFKIQGMFVIERINLIRNVFSVENNKKPTNSPRQFSKTSISF